MSKLKRVSFYYNKKETITHVVSRRIDGVSDDLRLEILPVTPAKEAVTCREGTVPAAFELFSNSALWRHSS